MNLRQKLIMFTVAFLSTAIIMGGGAFYLFTVLGDGMDLLRLEIRRHSAHSSLKDNYEDYIHHVSGWALSGQDRYLTQAGEQLERVSAAYASLVDPIENKAMIEAIGVKFEDVRKLSKIILSVSEPVGDARVLRVLSLLEAEEERLISMVNILHGKSLGSTESVLLAGEKIKGNLTYYLTVLVTLGLLTSALIVVLMRRIFEEPYKEMLRATEKVADGNLDYRIRSRSTDEFGLIANRFDSMVEALQSSDKVTKQKLGETELLLHVARVAGQTTEIDEALDLIVQAVSEKMSSDICSVYLLDADHKAFVLKSTSDEAAAGDTLLPLDNHTFKKMLEEFTPIVVENARDLPEGKVLCQGCASLMIIPIERDKSCIGALLLGSREPRALSAGELDAGIIIAHTIASAVRNIELYAETRSRLDQLSTVFELSRSLTSVYSLDDLLNTVSREIAKLINARGCVIRLMEDGMLRIKSHSGSVDDLRREEAIPVGKGIAGWVAKEGRSLFVEDVSKMPEDIRVQTIAKTSAIAVPLMVEDRIIGTLTLYDKLDDEGLAIPFTIDDFNAAKGFSSISAVAIDKARMQEQEQASEAEIYNSKRRLDLLFESVQGGIITMDRDFRITAANNFVQRWVDKPLREIIHKSALEVFHEKGGICPHCAATVTFDTGETNSITQSSGLNYAELSSYPLRSEEGEVVEAVVYVQDITDRVLYQEEIMGLYREVMQTKEYMESLISNSADAIVTSDLDGIVRSWNPAAEETYGYKATEVLGKFLPFIPGTLIEFEHENRVKISKGEVLRFEAIRKRREGTLIDVSITLSPIKDVTGEVIGISGISRDISDKKRVENELIRRNQELSRLFFISSAMRGTLELDRLQRMVLTAVTMSEGLGFNRAILLLLDEEKNCLRGAMGVGPGSAEEATEIWDTLSIEKRTLREVLREIEEGPMSKDSFLDRLSMGIELSLSEDTILTRAVKQKMAFNVTNVKEEPLSDSVLIQQLGTEAYAVVPLISRDKVIGALWVDNLFNKKPIKPEDMKFLTGFADQVASAVEAAKLFEQVSLAEAELENIFSSISDMVFFTDREYTIRKINQAVVDKIGLPAQEIVGSKCFRIFHGMEQPWPMCPHHKTVETMKPYVEELEDEHLDGVFLTSTSPIFDPDGVFLGTVHVVRDITELKELQNKLQSAERMAALGEVAAKVAHEIRNPLVSVGGFAGRLESKLDGNLKEYARIISKEVGRLEEILKDILGFVKEARISKRLTDINVVVSDILRLMGEEFAERGNTLVKELMESGPRVVVDPNRVKEAILNVVSNANQATEHGTITVRTYSRDGSVVVEVKDTGCGIKPDDIGRIFDPFFTTRPSGTGLGLAISKRIVEEHDGTITASSDYPAGGSTFKISIPLKEG